MSSKYKSSVNGFRAIRFLIQNQVQGSGCRGCRDWCAPWVAQYAQFNIVRQLLAWFGLAAWSFPRGLLSILLYQNQGFLSVWRRPIHPLEPGILGNPTSYTAWCFVFVSGLTGACSGLASVAGGRMQASWEGNDPIATCQGHVPSAQLAHRDMGLSHIRATPKW